ncbi:glycosyltransferase [Heyndrickxia coagulans]|uniref:glycosyltransferase n=1 Tax=Heyndrickxia coagulans TaxID=1398 RepID=UPI00215CC63C|nr:glycosyltransferase [Heyndrickxia coagulans]
MNTIKPFQLKLKLLFYERSLSIPKIVHDKKKIIVSLTTIPSRIDKVWLCIATLMDQKLKPDKIILWLDRDNFTKDNLPQGLLKLIKLGLEIRFCEDIRSHKKYYYTMKEYPNDIIITADDDIFYPRSFIKKFLALHRKNPNEVLCYRAHEILLDREGNVKRYNEWNQGSNGINFSSHFLLPTGVSGVLYPPNSLYKDVLNKDLLLKLAPFCDDIWLKIMEIKQGTKVRKVYPYSRHFPLIDNTQQEALYHKNVGNNNNDREFKNLIDFYNINIADLE